MEPIIVDLSIIHASLTTNDTRLNVINMLDDLAKQNRPEEVEKIVNKISSMLRENRNATNAKEFRKRRKQKIEVSVLVIKCFINGCVMLSLMS